VDLADRTYEYFERIRHDMFAGDPACNPALSVEVIGSGEVRRHPTLVLIGLDRTMMPVSSRTTHRRRFG
jgi:hypothetical protein